MTESPPVHRRARLRLVVFGTVLAATAALGLVPSSADTVGDKQKVDAGITRLRAELEDTSRELAQAFLKLRSTQAELPGARRALAAANLAQGVADRRNEAAATALAVAEANAVKAVNALAQNARDSQHVQDQVGNLVRDEYQRGAFSGLSIALEATSPEDFTNRMIVLDTVMRVRRATLRGLDVVRAEGIARQAHLVAVRRQVAALKAQAEAALAKADAARTAALAAKAKLDRLHGAQTRYAAAVAARKATETANLKLLQAQSDALTRVLAARARAAREAAARRAGQNAPRSVPPGSRVGFLSSPVNAPISSEFGMRLHPILRIWRLHAGTDFAAGCGSPVYAAAGGEVIMARQQAGGYGGQLVIGHGIRQGVDLTTTYSHLTRFVVTAGQVSRGDLVAYSGTSGLSTGCHLHFETRADGIPVNPRLWL